MQAGYVSWFSLWEVVKLSLYTRHPQLRRGGGSTLNEMSLSKPWKGRNDWLCKSIYRTVVIYSEYSSPPPLPVDSSWSVFFFRKRRRQETRDLRMCDLRHSCCILDCPCGCQHPPRKGNHDGGVWSCVSERPHYKVDWPCSICFPSFSNLKKSYTYRRKCLVSFLNKV